LAKAAALTSGRSAKRANLELLLYVPGCRETAGKDCAVFEKGGMVGWVGPMRVSVSLIRLNPGKHRAHTGFISINARHCTKGWKQSNQEYRRFGL